jgi:hypothetical protein
MDVVAQPIEELGAVGLRIDRLHPDMFAECAPFGAFRLGIDIQPLLGLPYAGQAAQRPRLARVSGETSGSLKTSSGMLDMKSSFGVNALNVHFHRGDNKHGD